MNERLNGLLPKSGIDLDHGIQQAINVIFSTYGDVVSVDQKKKSLVKYGRNENVQTTASTIWFTGQDDQAETYVADNTNSIDKVSSANDNDTEVVSIEGHTMSGGNKTFVVQTVTLTGQTAATLTTPLNRCTRIRHAQQSSTNILGEVYVYEDTAIVAGKPTDTTKIHITMPAGENTSSKASTSLSSQDYWIVTNYHAGLQEKSANLLASVELQVRPSGGVWYSVTDPLVLASGDDKNYSFDPFFVIPKNSDVRLVGKASTNGTELSGGISGYLAIVL